MKATLSLNFNPDFDSIAVVTAMVDAKPIMVITYDFCTGPEQNEHQIITQVVQPGGLAHYVQARLITAGSELIDSIFSGEDAPSTVIV